MTDTKELDDLLKRCEEIRKESHAFTKKVATPLREYESLDEFHRRYSESRCHYLELSAADFQQQRDRLHDAALTVAELIDTNYDHEAFLNFKAELSTITKARKKENNEKKDRDANKEESSSGESAHRGPSAEKTQEKSPEDC